MYNKNRMNKTNIRQILNLLIKEYGNREWQPHQSPISVLIQTILSQNTSDRNSNRAFKSLLASFSSWEDVANASMDEIENSIRLGGLGGVKSKYIKQALQEIKQKQDGFELAFLKQLPLDEARDWLIQLPGVGMKTASCVLLFSLGIPALPVDTHVARVTRRLGIVNPKTSVEKTHKTLEGLIPRDDVYRFHVLVIEHGRKICKAQRPLCHQCILQMSCVSYGIIEEEQRNRQATLLRT